LGAVQRLATVVVLGLTALAAVLILYLADESNRQESTAEAQQADAIERATANYISLCLACHGPAGEGILGPDAQGTGRIGLPIGGDTNATILNQTGRTVDGEVWSDPDNPQYGSGLEGRANYISNRIHAGARNADGTYRMPAFGADFNGSLNDAQIDELVVFIQNVDWNHVYNEAIEVSHGYPTPPPPPVTEAQQDVAEGGDQPSQSGDGDEGPSVEGTGPGAQPTSIDLVMVDLAFEPTELTIPANTDVTLNLINQGNLPHAFELADGSFNSGDIAGGQTGSVVVNLPPGEYDFICPVPGHADAGMVGKLIVTEGAPLAASPEASPGAAPEAGGLPTTVDLDMVDIAFEPTELTIPANTDVTLNLTNSGALPHAFQLEDGSVASSELAGGGSETLTLNLPPGEYPFICPVPGHADAGMVGTLIVVEGGGGAAPADELAGDDQATGGESAGAPTTVDLDMVDIAFEPVDFTIAANTDVTVNLTNSGALPHAFALDDGSLTSEELAGGGATTFTLNLPPGTYTYHCPVPGHADAGMVGTITVE
jgi:uncharacterized cupredoxin-like copper-binding protein/mono/diheme cytochrome c family protein